MEELRLRQILAEELEKETDLPPGAAEHIANVRTGALSPGLQAAIRAMQRAVEEALGVEADKAAGRIVIDDFDEAMNGLIEKGLAVRVGDEIEITAKGVMFFEEERMRRESGR